MLRKRIVIASIVLIFLTAIILASQFVSIGAANFLDSYGAVSIAFDKKQMRAVDKVVFYTESRAFEITDMKLIDSIVDETMVATHVDTNCPNDAKIELYAGETLVRSMMWSTCCDTVRVYDMDDTHWIFALEGKENGGCIYLSAELADEFYTLLAVME